MNIHKTLRGILILFLLATAQATPVSLELSGGSVINGELLSWDGKQAQIKAEFGTMMFKREQLSQKALDRLDLLSGDPQKMAARIAELEATVASLRKDNTALRQQLTQTEAQTASKPTSPVSGTTSNPLPRATQSSEVSYSKSSTGKRHNSRCRYYGSGKPCGPNDGVACKICGG